MNLTKDEVINLAKECEEKVCRESLCRGGVFPALTMTHDAILAFANAIAGDFYDYRESDDTYWLPEGWYERIDHWNDYDMIHINSTVTHWMSLPAAPDTIRANKE